MSSNKKNVVIVGGGFAGVGIARQLSTKLDASSYNLILINPRPFHVFLLATARLIVSDRDNLQERALIPFDKLFTNGNGTFRLGTVVSIHKKRGEKGGFVTLKDGDTVPYHALILTPGSVWQGPLSFPEAKEEVFAFVAEQRNKFSDAKNIVLIGGGAVGLELAGEIKDVWPDKKVTIVHGGDQLLNSTYPAKFRSSVEENTRARGVNVLLKERVEVIPEGPGVTTVSGKFLDADLVVTARGPKPNTTFVSSLGSEALNDDGFIKVRPTLQLVDHDDIFAAGDVLDVKEEKQAAKAGAHSTVVVNNVLSYLEGKPITKVYKGFPEMIIVTNGKNGGMSYLGFLWGIVLGNWFARLFKSSDLMVPQARKTLGYPS